ncbi:MAG TPA: hypothetical protein VGM91_19320 [Conexibacter sp.]|jgi:hypothetical protein
MMTTSLPEPELLEVVPWHYGFAHSWAMAWLIENAGTRDRLLDLLVPGGTAPWQLEGRVRREHRVNGARADLAFEVVDSVGRTVEVALETKVADPIKQTQLERYRDAGRHVVLYVPGVTGMLFAPNGPVAGETWVTGRQLADALEGVELPWIVGSYVRAVADEAGRMDRARAFARRERDMPAEDDARFPAADLVDAAWVAEAAWALIAAGATGIRVRSEANDRGLYWEGSRCEVPGANGVDLYLDVIADVRTHRRAIALKVGGGQQADRWGCLERAVAARPPSTEWVPCRKRRSQTQMLWKLNATDLSAAEVVQPTLAAAQFIVTLAENG